MSEVDVIIVGAGAAGLAAVLANRAKDVEALYAAETKAHVIKL